MSQETWLETYDRAVKRSDKDGHGLSKRTRNLNSRDTEIHMRCWLPSPCVTDFEKHLKREYLVVGNGIHESMLAASVHQVGRCDSKYVLCSNCGHRFSDNTLGTQARKWKNMPWTEALHQQIPWHFCKIWKISWVLPWYVWRKSTSNSRFPTLSHFASGSFACSRQQAQHQEMQWQTAVLWEGDTETHPWGCLSRSFRDSEWWLMMLRRWGHHANYHLTAMQSKCIWWTLENSQKMDPTEDNGSVSPPTLQGALHPIYKGCFLALPS